MREKKTLLKRLVLLFIPAILFASCSSQLKKPPADQKAFDSCSIAKPFENTQVSESMVAAGYTGTLNNYFGTDTSKLDLQHFFENGKLVKSIFYYENGKVQEEYTYKCGALNGIQKYYYENGKLSKAIPYSYGYRQGTGELYDENGLLRQQVFFAADSILSEKSFDEKGKLLIQ